jgi:hypothetical protein
MRRGDDERQLAGDVFDEVALSEDAVSRRQIFRMTAEDHAKDNNGA